MDKSAHSHSLMFMHDALDNLIRQPIDMPLNPLFFQKVKKELRELLEEHRAGLIERDALREEVTALKNPQSAICNSDEPKLQRGRPRK